MNRKGAGHMLVLWAFVRLPEDGSIVVAMEAKKTCRMQLTPGRSRTFQQALTRN